MNIVGIIVARIGSVQLPRKNMLDVYGRPWIEWAIRQAVYVKQIDYTILVTDSGEMGEIAKSYGVEVVIEPHDNPGFGGPGGGGSAKKYGIAALGDRTKEVEAYVGPFFSILKKPDDWDALISLYKEKGFGLVQNIVRITDTSTGVDLGGGHYLQTPNIKNHRLLAEIPGYIHARDWELERPFLTSREIEERQIYFEVEPWQASGDVDFRYQFDIAKFLFYKYVLKDGASMTPYEDYYNDKDADESGIKEALASFTRTRTQKKVMDDKGENDILQTRQEMYRERRTADERL